MTARHDKATVDQATVDQAIASLGTVLVQYERAMTELGWTMADVRSRDALRVLADTLEEQAARVAELEAALREIADFGAPGRKFRSPLASVIRLQGIARAALATDKEQA